MAEFKMTLQDLYDQLSGLDRYTPEDDATLRQRAIDIYSPQYQADLQRLRDQIEFQVDRQQRNAVKTGMQRSSYNQAQQASIRRGGLQSEADLSGAYEGNVANMYYNMLEREKDRKDAADQYRNQLLLQLYGMQPKGGSGGGRIAEAAKSLSNVGIASLLTYSLLNANANANANTTPRGGGSGPTDTYSGLTGGTAGVNYPTIATNNSTSPYMTPKAKRPDTAASLYYPNINPSLR